MNPSVGALLGLLWAAGMLLILLGIRAVRRPRLADRLSMRDRTIVHKEAHPVGALWLITLPVLTSLLARLTGDQRGTEFLRARLRRAGHSDDVERFRLEQLMWSGCGMGAGLVLALFVIARGTPLSPLVIVLPAILGAILGVFLCDRRLVTRTRKRAARMDQQLPTVAELMAFAVAAGESPIAALDRVRSTVHGDLADEISVCVADVRGGESFLSALRGVSDRSPSVSVGRFVDGVAVATERGTPMAEVLRSQAADARSAGHRQLMEGASKREVLMLTPVVFLVLPIVVVIALYPGIHGLSFAIP